MPCPSEDIQVVARSSPDAAARFMMPRYHHICRWADLSGSREGRICILRLFAKK